MKVITMSLYASMTGSIFFLHLIFYITINLSTRWCWWAASCHQFTKLCKSVITNFSNGHRRNLMAQYERSVVPNTPLIDLFYLT